MKHWIVVASVMFALGLYGCGGGSGESNTPNPGPGSPAITAQPAGQTANVGDTVEFSVVASGNTPLSYQWFRNSQIVPGATSPTYVIPQASGINANDQYSVSVSNAASPSGVLSSPATLSMRPVVGIDQVAGCIPAVNPPAGIDGVGAQALFKYPRKIATDASGNAYVIDLEYGLRKITPEGRVSTLPIAVGGAIAIDAAGNMYTDSGSSTATTLIKISPAGAVTKMAGGSSGGSIDGTGSAASFDQINGLAVDAAGNVYISENSNVVRRMSPSGLVGTLAGVPGVVGSADGAGAAASFFGPRGLTVDASGNVYVVDAGNFTVRRITQQRVVTTVAGTPGIVGSADGYGPAAQFAGPEDITSDAVGNLYVAESAAIRKIDSAGMVTTLAGKGFALGYADGIGAAAAFRYPRGIAMNTGGVLNVADEGNQVIRKVTADGVVTTLAGRVPQALFDTCAGSADGSRFAARFNLPRAIAVDASGNVFVADTGNHTVRKLSATGTVTTLAGSPGLAGNDDGIGNSARFSGPLGIAVDTAGNVYVADTGNHLIRKITPVGVVTTVAGTQGLTSTSLTIDGAGNIYASDRDNASIRKIAPDGTISTLARGSGAGNIAADSTGNVYVTTQRFVPSGFGAYYDVVSKVTPQGVVSVLAGGVATPTLFRSLAGIAVDKSGNVYVADSGYYSIFRISASGTVTTLAGQPYAGGQPGTVGTKLGPFPGSLTFPSGLALIGSGADSRLLAVDMDAILAVTLSP